MIGIAETPDTSSMAGTIDQAGLDKNRNRIELKNGGRAEVEIEGNAEKLKVFSKRGEMLFEYDAHTGKSRIHIPEGDLEFITRKGSIDFISADRISFSSRNAIKMNSREIGVAADSGAFDIEETRYKGRNLSARMGHVNLIADRIESVAGTVFEKAVNMYRTVEELIQLKAGRMRTLVKKTYQFKSRKAFLKTEEDIKIKGEKIHLG